MLYGGFVIVCVVGPTGVGKTKMSIALAKKYDGIVINCDAVQIYRELDIGSAKVTEGEKEGVEHYLFDIKSPLEEYTVKNYQYDLRALLEKYSDRFIVIVGGTGLYLSAGIYDYRFNGDITDELLYQVKIVGLTTSREHLYNIINNRVDQMIQEGLIEEVKTLYEKYPNSRVLNSAIGYKEIISYLNNNIDKDAAIELIKKNSRHYAKRQYTWFRNKMDVKWFDVNYEDFDQTIRAVELYIDGEE